MSHELRTPPNALIGYSELLEEDAADLGGGRLVPDLQKIAVAAKHQLSLINDILELHGGPIWVKSQVGQGSTFTFTLPVHRDR